MGKLKWNLASLGGRMTHGRWIKILLQWRPRAYKMTGGESPHAGLKVVRQPDAERSR